MALTEATGRNIQYVDDQIRGSFGFISGTNVPRPAWIEIGLNDFCNRRCVFCPKSEDEIAPNHRHLLMPPNLAEKIAADLQQIGFDGLIMLAGYGEPMATPHLFAIIRQFAAVCRVEITTNGDFLQEENARGMVEAGIGRIVVSMYDGPEQIGHFTDLFCRAKVPADKFLLRDRWYGPERDFGIKLTNRAGTVYAGNQAPLLQTQPCYYPHYSMMVDWNGDVFLCTQDWNRRVKSGNLALSSVKEVWTGSFYRKYRLRLFRGERSLPPCRNCNCDGTLHGRTHAECWEKHYREEDDDS